MSPTKIFLFIVFLLAAVPSFAVASEANLSVSVERIGSTPTIKSTIILAIATLALLFVLVMLVRYIITEKKKKRALKEKVQTMDKDEAEYYMENIEPEEHGHDFSAGHDIEKYLKEDERRVVSILKQRGGICSQSTLRIAGNFSKATLSRLLKELEERNVVKKEQRGKKNLVILK